MPNLYDTLAVSEADPGRVFAVRNGQPPVTYGDLDAQSAGASAATPALTIHPGDTLQRAAQVMTEHAIAHLLVVDDTSGEPVGVLSTLDLARVLAGHSLR